VTGKNKCILCHFENLIGFDINLFHVQICCCKANHTAQSHELVFLVFHLNIHHIKKMFQVTSFVKLAAVKKTI